MTNIPDDRSWDPVQLKEKELEPDKGINKTDRVSRNLQLGNWPRRDMMLLYHELERGINLESFPDNRNGWLYKKFGRTTFEKIDLKMVASNSADALGRISLNTMTKINRVKDDTPVKGFMNGFLGSSQGGR